MAKYRIIQTKEGFTSQKRFLWFWRNTRIQDYYVFNNCVYVGTSQTWIVVSESLEKAKEHLHIVMSFPRKYGNHKIEVGYRNGCYYYVDTKSLTFGINDAWCYTRWAKSFEDLIAYIDKYEEEKKETKDEIINVIEL